MTAAPDGKVLGGHRAFAAMVHGFYERGYACTTFAAFSPARQDVILRHDVDADLETALAIARLEYTEGWRATFFVMLNNGVYDLAARAGREALDALMNMEHDIGLHFDPVPYGTAADIEAVIAHECDSLEKLLGKDVTVIAPHQPSQTCPEWLGWDHAPAGRVHAYQPRYFHEAGYVSDSAGYWSYGHPLAHPKAAAGRGMQILTHPHLWRAP